MIRVLERFETHCAGEHAVSPIASVTSCLIVASGLVFVSCFPSRAQMRKYLADIVWETEVWCADNPTHLIHLNGERFLGPY